MTLNSKINVLFTQAVMEHIIDLENTYRIMYEVLVPGGMNSHEIDYSFHETHEKWNGHLNYGDFLWKIIMHGRSNDINRKPHSEYIECLKRQNFIFNKRIGNLSRKRSVEK